MSKPINIKALAAATQPVVKEVQGKATTTSQDVAALFGKQHGHVLRAIENLLQDAPDACLSNFGETVVTRPSPLNGAPIKSKAYRMTRDGFTLLAMGFNGKKALAFKLAYIEAFNRMERALQADNPTDRTRLPGCVAKSVREAARRDGDTIEWEGCVFITPSYYKHLPVRRWLVTREGNKDAGMRILPPETLVTTLPELIQRIHQDPLSIGMSEHQRWQLCFSLMLLHKINILENYDGWKKPDFYGFSAPVSIPEPTPPKPPRVEKPNLKVIKADE